MTGKFLWVIIFSSFTTILFSQDPGLFAKIEKQFKKDIDSNLVLYKYLHQNPELSFQEKETSKRIAGELNALGFEVTEKVGGFGVVGIFKNGEGPVIMLRTDLDALPIEEKTGLTYASEVKSEIDGNEVPVMHACGHDMHMSSFVGTAKIMVSLKDDWSGTLFMLGQPAEERGGAKYILEDGLFNRFPVPDMAFAYHVDPTLEAGKIGYIPGPAWAKVNTLEITVHGLGGHGARPHQAIDPIVLSARIILAIQTIVSREIKATDPAVITVGAVNGGTKHNIIPSEVHLMLTLRSYSEEVAAHMISSIKRICKGIALSAGLSEELYPIVVEVDESLPPGINDPDLTTKAAMILIEAMGDSIEKIEPTMGAEDFFRYGNTLHNIPVCMFRLGSTPGEMLYDYAKKGKTIPSLHSPQFAPEPVNTLEAGTRAMSLVLIKMFNSDEKKTN